MTLRTGLLEQEQILQTGLSAQEQILRTGLLEQEKTLQIGPLEHSLMLANGYNTLAKTLVSGLKAPGMIQRTGQLVPDALFMIGPLMQLEILKHLRQMSSMKWVTLVSKSLTILQLLDKTLAIGVKVLSIPSVDLAQI